MKTITLVFLFIVASVFISGVTGRNTGSSLTVEQDTTKIQKSILENQKAILRNQDSMMKNQNNIIKNQDSIKQQQPQRKITDEERKKMEYMEWQQRSKSIDKSLDQLDRQSMKMDSLLGKPKKK